MFSAEPLRSLRLCVRKIPLRVRKIPLRVREKLNTCEREKKAPRPREGAGSLMVVSR